MREVFLMHSFSYKYKNNVFLVQAKYSYFLPIYGLKYFCEYSQVIACDISSLARFNCRVSVSDIADCRLQTADYI